jgi:hypothetical protein
MILPISMSHLLGASDIYMLSNDIQELPFRDVECWLMAEKKKFFSR